MSKARPDLSEIVEKWQARLPIRDWKIRARYVRGKSKILGGDDAASDWTSPLMVATIYVKDPRDYVDAVDGDKQDVEADVLHELVHVVLHWAIFNERDALYLPWEQSVEGLTHTLLALDRGEA